METENKKEEVKEKVKLVKCEGCGREVDEDNLRFTS